MAGPQKDASGADTWDSLFSDSDECEIGSDKRRHSEDLGGERGEGGERGMGNTHTEYVQILLAI